MGDELRPEHTPNIDQSAQRHHLAGPISDVEIRDVIEPPAVVRIGLDPNLKALIKFVEQIDIGGTQVCLQGLKDVVHRHAQGFRHDPVDAQLQLRAFGIEGGCDTAQPGFLVGRQQNLLHRFLELARSDAGTILDHHLEPSRNFALAIFSAAR